MKKKNVLASALAAIGLTAASIAVPGTANAQIGGVRTETVRSASGFGGGTIYMPSSGSNLGAVVIAPGFTAGSGSYRSIARDMAGEGFVAFAIDTNTRSDQPDSRGRQLKAATDHLLQRSGARSMIDPNKVAVSGHSMGGGGSLRAANDNPQLYKAAVPLQPWHGTKSWSRLTVPTLIIGAQRDTIASNRSHSLRFYNSIPSSTDKMFIELSGAGHMVASTGNRQQTAYMAAWLKRFLDGDTSQDSLLCGSTRTGLSSKQSTCPFSGGSGGSGDDGGGSGGSGWWWWNR
jgi:dienelactone hydrolase